MIDDIFILIDTNMKNMVIVHCKLGCDLLLTKKNKKNKCSAGDLGHDSHAQ